MTRLRFWSRFTASITKYSYYCFTLVNAKVALETLNWCTVFFFNTPGRQTYIVNIELIKKGHETCSHFFFLKQIVPYAKCPREKVMYEKLKGVSKAVGVTYVKCWS